MPTSYFIGISGLVMGGQITVTQQQFCINIACVTLQSIKSDNFHLFL